MRSGSHSGDTAPRCMLATYHLLVMVIATALFAAAWAAQRRGYIGGDVTTLGLILGVAAFRAAHPGAGSRALADVYGVRVVDKRVAIADALIPGRLEQSTPSRARGARTDWTGWTGPRWAAAPAPWSYATYSRPRGRRRLC
ncbi:MAG: hypothetical protein QOF69_3660 [Solirubrobacteraceae bacterium]|nr:hypothetical protein [Solirubrobacteraceae bacterium]